MLNLPSVRYHFKLHKGKGINKKWDFKSNQVFWGRNCWWSTKVGYAMHGCVTVEHRYVAVDHSWPTWCQMYTGGNTFLDNVSIKAHTEQNLYECCSSDLQFPKEPTGH